MINSQNFHFQSQIWKIFFDISSNILAVECRNIDTYKIEIYIIDILNGEKKYLDLDAELNWWCNLAGVFQNHLVFYEFNQKEYANHQRVFCINTLDLEKKWEFFDTQFQSLDHNLIKLSNTDQNFVTNFIQINIVTGKESSLLKTGKFRQVKYPDIHNTQSLYWQQLSKFLLLKTNYHVINQIQFLDCGHFIVLSYYHCIVDNLLTQDLIFLDSSGNEISRNVISENTRGVDYGSFFAIDNNYIVFIENQNRITINHLQLI